MYILCIVDRHRQKGADVPEGKDDENIVTPDKHEAKMFGDDVPSG